MKFFVSMALCLGLSAALAAEELAPPLSAQPPAASAPGKTESGKVPSQPAPASVPAASTVAESPDVSKNADTQPSELKETETLASDSADVPSDGTPVTAGDPLPASGAVLPAAAEPKGAEGTSLQSSTGAAVSAPAAMGEKTVATTAATTDAVPQVKGLLKFHETEMTGLKKLHDRWNAILAPIEQRRKELTGKIAAGQKKIADLRTEGTKAARKEASALDKQVNLMNRDLKSVGRERQAQVKALTDELQKKSAGAGRAMTEAYQQAVKDIQSNRGD